MNRLLNVVSVASVHELMAHFVTQRDRAQSAGAPIAAGVLSQVLAEMDAWLLKQLDQSEAPEDRP